MKESVLQKMKQYKNKQVSIFPSKRKEPLLRTPGPEIKDLGAEVPKLFGIRDQFCGKQFFHGWGWGDGLGLTRPLTFCCVAWLLTGLGLVPVPGPRLGTQI